MVIRYTSCVVACNVIYIRENSRPEVNIFSDPKFKYFADSLDCEMKNLTSHGIGVIKKQAQPLSEQEEDVLWQKGILGESTPQCLLQTMLFLIGQFFALRSGDEHRSLKFGQLTLLNENGREKLCYNSHGEKTWRGGLRDRKYKNTGKVIKHHANVDNPSRCLVRLFKKYVSKW